MIEQLTTSKSELRDPSLVDRAEAAIAEMVPAVMPLTHRFTPGLYIREIFIPAGTMLTSREHKLEHPFVISKGRIAVSSDNEGKVIYTAPHTGITQPGTRRVLFAYEDTVWTTFHLNPEEERDPDKIVLEVTEEHDNPLVEKDDSRFMAWSKEHTPSRTIALKEETE